MTNKKDGNPKDNALQVKAPLWLLSPIAKSAWACAQFVGNSKYGPFSWRDGGARASVYLSAAMRHLDAFLSGEDIDPIDQTSHLGHVMANAAILLDAMEIGNIVDDRPAKVDMTYVHAECERQMRYTHARFADSDEEPRTLPKYKEEPIEDLYKQANRLNHNSKSTMPTHYPTGNSQTMHSAVSVSPPKFRVSLAGTRNTVDCETLSEALNYMESIKEYLGEGEQIELSDVKGVLYTWTQKESGV